MDINNSYKPMYLSRMTAIALLVRLGNADIPYPHSKRCREQLIYYLSYILIDEERDEHILKIDYEELCAFVEDIDSAMMIIEHYCVKNN